MKIFNFLILFIINKRFRSSLEGVLYYALSSWKKNRGDGSTEVLFFNHDYSEKIFTKESLDKIYTLQQNYQCFDEANKLVRKLIDEKKKRSVKLETTSSNTELMSDETATEWLNELHSLLENEPNRFKIYNALVVCEKHLSQGYTATAIHLFMGDFDKFRMYPELVAMEEKYQLRELKRKSV